MSLRKVLACLVLAMLPLGFASAAPLDALSLPVVTRHTGIFGGKHVAYKAVVERIDVADASGKPGARLVCFSYLAAGKRGDRPVLFAFNGGPITPSDILHMGALGPKRVAIPDDVTAPPSSYKVVDNVYTPLDVADIVFIDPASTGFSRVADGVDPKGYFSVTADAQQVAQFIVAWSQAHRRMDSPKYLIGESYGTNRAAAVANQLQKMPQSVNLQGVVLMGQALNIIEFSQRPANLVSYAVSLPTLAAIAWSHGKVDLGGKTFDQFEDEVRLFARTDYLEALFPGAALPQERRAAIAGKLATYTGLPASYYLAHDLEITKEQYRRELFRDQKQILGMIDARYVGPVSKEVPDPASVITKAYESAFKDYLRDDLKVADTADYVTADPVSGLNDWGWNGTGISPFADWPYPALLSEVFAANPKFRVMVMNGWQDTQTTVGAAQLLVDRSGWPQDRVSLHFYQGGHTAYSVEDSLKRMTADVRTFVTP